MRKNKSKEKPTKPYLIQRLHTPLVSRTNKEGVDAFFDFDYMGAAEFEFGALNTALKSMRSQVGEYTSEPVRIKEEGQVVWYVGPTDEDMIASATELFNSQRKKATRFDMRFKMPTYIHYHYDPQDEYETQQSPVGWWAIDQPKPWLLFVRKDSARNWIKGMKFKA